MNKTRLKAISYSTILVTLIIISHVIAISSSRAQIDIGLFALPFIVISTLTSIVIDTSSLICEGPFCAAGNLDEKVIVSIVFYLFLFAGTYLLIKSRDKDGSIVITLAIATLLIGSIF